MPTFDVEISGTPYEVDAPDAQSAAMGAQKYANDTAVTPDALVRQAVRGIPVVGGLANKFAAMMDAATQPVLGRGSSAPTYEQRYAENYPQQEAQDVAFEQANPVTATAAQVAGGVGALGPIGAGTDLGAIALGARGTSLGSRTLASTISGGGINALDALSRGQDVGPAAAIGAGLGAVIPGTAAGIGAGIRGIRGALGATPTSSLASNVERIAGVDLPFTTGEATGNAAVQGFERNAARGTEGGAAQSIAQPFYEDRLNKVSQATQNIQANMSPTGTVQAETPTEAGNIIGGALAAEKANAQAGVNKLYDTVRANPAVIPADDFSYLARRVKADLTTAKDQVRIDPSTTPAAAKMLDQLDQWRGVPIDKANFLAPSKATGSTMADIDQVRQTLLATKANASTFQDQRAAGRVINAFDKQIDTIAPSPDLSAARAAHAQYRQTFFQNGPRDDIGRAMEKIIGNKGAQPATPEEVTKLLYNSPEGNSPRLVERLKQVFGANSPQFAAVKQGYLSNILEPQSGQAWDSGKMATQLEKALQAKGAGLTRATLNQREILELQQLRNYLRKITPLPTAGVNYSGTAAPILKHLRGNLPNYLLGLMGLHAGGPIGAAIGMAAGPVKEHIGSALAGHRVARSLYGTPPVAPLSPAAAAAIRSIHLLPPVLAPQLSQPVAPPINQ